MYTYVGVVVVYIYFMYVLDVLMYVGGGLYLRSVHSMCAYVCGGGGLYLLYVYICVGGSTYICSLYTLSIYLCVW